jgi:hypothetical protein
MSRRKSRRNTMAILKWSKSFNRLARSMNSKESVVAELLLAMKNALNADNYSADEPRVDAFRDAQKQVAKMLGLPLPRSPRKRKPRGDSIEKAPVSNDGRHRKPQKEQEWAMKDAIQVPLDSAEIELVNNCSQALGVAITELDIEFADGTVLANVSLADGSMALPGERSGKPIKKISVPLEQRVSVRTKGYAAVSDRMNNRISMGTTVMLWVTSGRR